MTHQKPTEEELKAKVEEATQIPEEELNAPPMDEPETPETPETPAPEPEQPEVPETPKPEEPETPEQPKETPEEEKDRLKKENKASAREAQKIYAKNRVLNQAIIDAEGMPEPTEEELQKEYPDWDVMSDVERSLAKETVVSRNWRSKIKDASDQASKIEKWNESVETFTDDPKTLVENPDLEGKTEEFKEFATKSENNSVPFKILIGAFLHEQSTKKVEHKGKMFEEGNGGPNDKPQPTSGKISLEEAGKLRQTDYAKYKEYLKAGKIELDV